MRKLKFIADADLNEHITLGIRRTGFNVDFRTADEGGTRGLSDRQVLKLASASGRVVVSHDRNTMAGDFYRYISAGNSSPGLIIVEQTMDKGEAIQELLLISVASDPNELNNQIQWVPL
jgi:Domain of unknown function (DUF5615)